MIISFLFLICGNTIKLSEKIQKSKHFSVTRSDTFRVNYLKIEENKKITVCPTPLFERGGPSFGYLFNKTNYKTSDFQLLKIKSDGRWRVANTQCFES